MKNTLIKVFLSLPDWEKCPTITQYLVIAAPKLPVILVDPHPGLVPGGHFPLRHLLQTNKNDNDI
jgi:hypothetical protein